MWIVLAIFACVQRIRKDIYSKAYEPFKLQVAKTAEEPGKSITLARN